MKKLTYLLGATALATTNLMAQDDHSHHAHHHHGANHYGPIGVMGDHQHEPGKWMTSYRYGHMKMDGLRSGTDSVTPAAARAGGPYMMVPLDMEMRMHMFGVMYGVNDTLTLMAMTSYQEKDMTMENGALVQSKMKSDGIGDTKVTGLYTLYDGDAGRIHANMGLSLPTGSIDERNGAGTKLPYGMQLGSGTVDPLVGVTYAQQHDGWSWGAQANSVLRFGENDEGYRLGNEYNITPWVMKEVGEYTSLSLRLDGRAWGGIKGVDSELNTAMLPNDTANSGGERIDALVGINLYQPSGTLEGHRLSAEFGAPIYQRLDGTQLEVDYRFTLGWQWSF